MQQLTLKNGIRCILNDTQCNQSVAINIMVKVGSRDESPKNRGIAHFVEHLFFKGTKKRPTPLQISKIIDRHGAEINASTGLDVTYYYCNIDYRKIEIALELLSDILYNSKFTKKDIDSEKSIVINELNLYRNNPSKLNGILFRELLYQDTTLEHDIGGDIEVIKKISRKQVLDFVRKFYVAENIVISISGRIDESIKMLLEKYFSRHFYSRHSPSRKLFPNFYKFQKKGRFRHQFRSDIKGSYILLGFPTINFNHPSFSTLLVLNCILGQGMSSRLFTTLRSKKSMVYNAKSNVESFEDIGSMVISCQTHVKDIREVFDIIWKILENLQNIKKKELQRAKDFIIGNILLKSEDNLFSAYNYAYNLIMFDKIETINKFTDKIKKVKAKDISNLAKKIFTKNKVNANVISNQSLLVL